MPKSKVQQSIVAGDNTVLVQAGRDVLLSLKRSLPDLKLVRLTIDQKNFEGSLQQKLNIVLKNNGDTTAFLLNGCLVQTGKVTITNCNELTMKYKLSEVDWTYDLDIDEEEPSFTGKHSIAPNEVVTFNIVIGRKRGGHEVTVYRAFLRLDFDEGGSLETDQFHFMISGPKVFHGSFVAQGPSAEQWAECMVGNIRRLDEIGYDFRPMISKKSYKYIETAAPGLLEQRSRKSD